MPLCWFWEEMRCWSSAGPRQRPCSGEDVAGTRFAPVELAALGNPASPRKDNSISCKRGGAEGRTRPRVPIGPQPSKPLEEVWHSLVCQSYTVHHAPRGRCHRVAVLRAFPCVAHQHGMGGRVQLAKGSWFSEGGAACRASRCAGRHQPRWHCS